jgi:hypothetical protein
MWGIIAAVLGILGGIGSLIGGTMRLSGLWW